MNQISTSLLEIKKKEKQLYNLDLENITSFEFVLASFPYMIQFAKSR